MAPCLDDHRRLIAAGRDSEVMSSNGRLPSTWRLAAASIAVKQQHVSAGGLILGPTFAKAADQPDKAAVKQATATCRAEVKEHAKYNEMSLWAQHKAVKKCVAEALAKH